MKEALTLLPCYIDKMYALFVKVCFVVYLCVLQPPRKLNVMKKLIVLAVIFQISTSCGENYTSYNNPEKCSIRQLRKREIQCS